MNFLRFHLLFAMFFVIHTLPCVLAAQPSDFSTEEKIHKESLRSVGFGRSGLPFAFPLIRLGSDETLRLSFDDLEDEAQTFEYTVVHCDADWQPSDISPYDFIDGFDEDYIRSYEFSNQTLMPYVHYELGLPNENMRFKISGNYLLLVYDEDEQLVLTRRFLIVENKWQIEALVARATASDQYSTHQDVRFTMLNAAKAIRNPMRELRATVLQNFRWDTGIYGITPLNITEKNISFNYLGKAVFPAGNEFRFVDLMSASSRSGKVLEMYRDSDNTIEVELAEDKPRRGMQELISYDKEGRFQTVNHLEADYMNVHFFLQKEFPFEGASVYLFGQFTDWKINDRYKMRYNYEAQRYEGAVLLKQGFYNYNYALVPDKGDRKPSWDDTEGNWYETTNNYSVIVYYRPFGQRYDAIAAFENMNE
jgi:hypothetical protein